MITAEATDAASGVAVQVGPGGGLRSLTLSQRSLRLGGEALAATILGLVRTATAQANRLARNALPAQLGGTELGRTELGGADLDALGLGVDPELADAIELTTPDTWMR